MVDFVFFDFAITFVTNVFTAFGRLFQLFAMPLPEAFPHLNLDALLDMFKIPNVTMLEIMFGSGLIIYVGYTLIKYLFP